MGTTRNPKKQRDPAIVVSIPDGRHFFSVADCAARLSITENAVHKALGAGRLLGEKIRGRWIIPSACLRAYEGAAAERDLVDSFERGKSALDAWRASGVNLEQTIKVLRHWADLRGWWLIEGPPGSFARFLERHQLSELAAGDLRRVIVAILDDPHTRRVARLEISRQANLR